MRCVDELSPAEIKGKRVLVRSDFNLPISAQGEVADVFRLEMGWKTVQYLSERGARLILLSHIGRDQQETIEPVARAIEAFGKVTFVPALGGALVESTVQVMKDGEIVLLENVRRDPRETTNDESFARELASLADMYVNDAFAASHRTHTSIVGVPKFLPAYAGLLVRDEVKEINAARTPKSPSFAILGGAKFETKAPLVKMLLEKYDHLFITGALANDVFKARGLPVGRSLISKEQPGEDILNNPRFLAPTDVTVENTDGSVKVKRPEEVSDGDKIVDIGPETVALLAPYLRSAKFILWNGPTGMYENGHTIYVKHITALVSEAVKNGAHCVIGGGDTIAAIEASGASKNNLGFLSTGGGAMLEYLLKGTLPGIEALG